MSKASRYKVARQEPVYDITFPTEPIGGDNPHHRCVYCKISVPAINGDVAAHAPDCEWRLARNYSRAD